MAKLDEITELLTEELEGFRKAISELHAVSKELKSSEVVLDIYTIKRQISDLNEIQNDHFQKQGSKLHEFNGIMANAKLTPKWLLTLFCILVGICVIALSYFGYNFVQLDDIKSEAINNGKEQIILDLRGYFDEHPDVYKGFQSWSREQERVPNQK